MRDPVRYVVLAIGAVVLLSGCTAAQQTLVSPMPTVPPSVEASAPARPTIAPTVAPSISAMDATAAARATVIVTSLGGSVTPGYVGVVPPLPGVPGEFVSVGSWGVQWDPQGKLIFVAVLPPFVPSAPRTVISEAVARTTIADYRTRLGLVVAPPDSLVPDLVAGGWWARWYRQIGGIAAPSEGTSMAIDAAGDFLSYRYIESAAKSAPVKTISQAKALSQFPRCRNSTGGANGLVETCSVKLEWHASAMTPGAPLQLCWRIDYTRRDSDGSLASVLWLDAATGEQVDAGTTT
jgi:hypothetical protein